MLPTEPYDQRKTDPMGWRFSIGVLACLAAIGLLIAGAGAWSLILGAAGLFLIWRSTRG